MLNKRNPLSPPFFKGDFKTGTDLHMSVVNGLSLWCKGDRGDLIQ